MHKATQIMGIVALCLIVNVAVLLFMPKGVFLPHISRPTLDQVSTLTSLAFPDDTQLLASKKWWQLQARYLFAKVQFRRKYLDSFFESLPDEFEDFQNNRNFVSNDVMARQGIESWWNPDAVKDYRVGGYYDQEISRASVNILVDLDDPEHVTVFINVGW